MAGVNSAGGAQQGQVHKHQHQHQHRHGQGADKGQGLKLGQSEDFQALKEAKKNGEIEGPFGLAVQDLKADLRASQSSDVVSSEATAAASSKSETSTDIESKLSAIVKSTEDGEAQQQEVLTSGFKENAEFFK